MLIHRKLDVDTLPSKVVQGSYLFTLLCATPVLPVCLPTGRSRRTRQANHCLLFSAWPTKTKEFADEGQEIRTSPANANGNPAGHPMQSDPARFSLYRRGGRPGAGQLASRRTR